MLHINLRDITIFALLGAESSLVVCEGHVIFPRQRDVRFTRTSNMVNIVVSRKNELNWVCRATSRLRTLSTSALLHLSTALKLLVTLELCS